MELAEKQKEAVDFFLSRGIIVSHDFLSWMDEDFDVNSFYEDLTEKIESENFLLVNKEIPQLLDVHETLSVNWYDLEKYKVLYEKGIDKTLYTNFMELLVKTELTEPKTEAEAPKTEQLVETLFSYKEQSKKRTMQDFVSYFRARYESIKRILMNRQEMQEVTSISRVINKQSRDNVAIIGIVTEKNLTKNKNFVLVVEDYTGSTKVLINKNKPELYNQAKDIVLDEVIGISGVNGDNIVFANNVLWPEVPLNKELKKSPVEEYAVFISDLHFGSTNFLPEKFQKFLGWINGESGSEEQREIAKKTKYIFITGDLVDGVGVYPSQESELIIKDIYAQYEGCGDLLKQIPSHISIIICPGNHDAMRIAEPQPPLYKDFAKVLWELPNVTMVSNPAMVNVAKREGFPGFDVLLYHGFSFIYYADNVESIRMNGGIDRPDLIMKFLLQRRHLAPSHTSTLYIPDEKNDNLVIRTVPDFFISGHIHKATAANYKNITLICGSCWQSKTSFEEKLGLHPEPAKVPVVNLQTRAVKLLRF
ncbi:DNA-directed DNA polymerase II small subunit [Candidatus Woesearchaeota archaeon]|nr:DNA-directed DNA polymerase II small subunit [Candidatus Woesearchaeota archaeon]